MPSIIFWNSPQTAKNRNAVEPYKVERDQIGETESAHVVSWRWPVQQIYIYRGGACAFGTGLLREYLDGSVSTDELETQDAGLTF